MGQVTSFVGGRDFFQEIRITDFASFNRLELA